LGSFTCDGLQLDCDDGGQRGRMLIVDLANMVAVDAGLDIPCTCDAPHGAWSERCLLNPGERFCYSAAELANMMSMVRAGCAAAGRCDFPGAGPTNRCPNQCTGKAYPISRDQTGLSGDPGTQSLRVVPYNDRPSVGGAGAALRFDGKDDFAAATVERFPREELSVARSPPPPPFPLPLRISLPYCCL